MTVAIKIDFNTSLETAHHDINTGLALRLREIKKNGAPWPKVKFLGIQDGHAVYRVGK